MINEIRAFSSSESTRLTTQTGFGLILMSLLLLVATHLSNCLLHKNLKDFVEDEKLKTCKFQSLLKESCNLDEQRFIEQFKNQRLTNNNVHYNHNKLN